MPTGSYAPLPSTPTTTTRSSSPSSPTSYRPSLMPIPFTHRLKARNAQVALFAVVLLLVTLPFAHYNREKVQDHWAADYITTDASTQHVPVASGGLANIPLTLEARIQYLLTRPALAQWEAELPSRHGCPFYTYSRNTYFFHDGKPEQWEQIGPNDIVRYRAKIVDYFREVEREGGRLIWDQSMEAEAKEDRRGIIFTGGEGKTLERLKLSLHMLKNVIKSTLPVQVYHFPDELQDPDSRAELEAFGVELVVASEKRPDGKSWHIKNAAFLATRFTEFVYMDSDNIPLNDPRELFDSVEYKQSGSVFWADLNKDHPDNAIFRIVGKSCTDDHWPAETGQIVFSKRANNGLNLAILHLSNHMMSNSDMYGFLSYGDKDTFRYSFYALGLPYQQAPKIFATAGGYQTQNGEDSDKFCGHSMIQWGLTPWTERHNPAYHPKPAFLHTILGKHRYNLQPSKLFSHIHRPRLDGINEPLLVRTPYDFTGDCFALTLKGPDGAPGAVNSMGDGQGVETVAMGDVIGDDNVWGELKGLSETFVHINHND
ncbi:hypothetical protein I350_01645 [Cryptococcus amylolentus CBS 6273]|uniref:Uncharacterized protein n=1 Tax=Cryptococcus amylolentus CBS 6273 TaxID=1296118 RepID=A0A1E3KDS4_9TREE|nr:hypothetical protein I350_01645 [Cryptococcus amylolentus CBS 6273]